MAFLSSLFAMRDDVFLVMDIIEFLATFEANSGILFSAISIGCLAVPRLFNALRSSQTPICSSELPRGEAGVQESYPIGVTDNVVEEDDLFSDDLFLRGDGRWVPISSAFGRHRKTLSKEPGTRSMILIDGKLQEF